ncbi:hypothetical protein LC612_28000 [Nostoc sp. CHAB 5834]|nr:hypothetical protein [Nostoc sp. CHAB 5834]
MNFIDEGQSLSIINTTDVIFQEGSASNILSIDEGLSLNEDQSLDEAQNLDEDQSLDEAQNLDEDQSLDEYQSLGVIDPTEAVFQKGSTPNLLSTIQREVISRLRVVASWRGRRPRDNSLSAVYTAPPGFVILSVQTVVHSSNNGSRSVSVLGSNLSLITETDITEVYNQFINVAVSKNDQQLKGNLEQKMNSHINELRKYQSTHNVIEAIVKASTHGNIFDRKRGWEEISVFAELMYLGGSKPDVAASLEREFFIKTSVPVANASVQLKGNNGQYVCAENSGGESLVVNRDVPLQWESFILINIQGTGLQDGSLVAIKCNNGQFVSAQNGGGSNLIANANSIGPWETFTIKKIGGGTIQTGDSVVFLCNDKVHYLCAEGGGGQQVVANRTAIGPWETFVVTVLPLVTA